MSVIYTKSALKKIKKDDLIDIYLSQQQKMSQLLANTEKLNDELEELKDDYHQKGIDEQEAIEACENAEEQVEELTEQVEELKEKLDEGTEQHLADTQKLNKFYMKTEEENEKLKNFDNWENHPALKHKVVLDEDFYQEHTDDDGELIDPDEHADAVHKLDCITKYVAGDFSMQDEVEEHLEEIYSKEFINGNTEHWKEFGLFEEDEDSPRSKMELQGLRLVLGTD